MNECEDIIECRDAFNCCDCGGVKCGCPYCFSCNACDCCIGAKL